MSKLATILVLLAGTALLLYWGGEAPRWVLKLECAGVMLAALAYGFTRHNLRLPEWTRDDALRGVALVYLGIGAMFVELNILAAAFLIGSGVKLVTRSANALTARVITPAIGGIRTEILHLKGGGIRRRE